MSVWLPVECPDSHSTQVALAWEIASSKQRYRCNNCECLYRTSVLSENYPARTRQVKQQIVEMTINGSGVRDIARVLHTSPTTVINQLNKTRASRSS